MIILFGFLIFIYIIATIGGLLFFVVDGLGNNYLLWYHWLALAPAACLVLGALLAASLSLAAYWA